MVIRADQQLHAEPDAPARWQAGFSLHLTPRPDDEVAELAGRIMRELSRLWWAQEVYCWPAEELEDGGSVLGGSVDVDGVPVHAGLAQLRAGLQLADAELELWADSAGARQAAPVAFGAGPSTAALHNPYLTAFEQVDQDSAYAWGPRQEMVRQFSWAVPSQAAIDAIAQTGAVVEIGAGSGYWTYLLRQAGVDVAAYDPEPGGGQAEWAARQWTPVSAGDHRAVDAHPDRTLLMCWPEYDALWTADAIDRYSGDRVVMIGEGPYGCTGHDRMHELLEERFERVGVVHIPTWATIHDDVEIWQRRR